ncbi:U1 small nuclear ribonucleoprotein C [Ananas comosus]|uniref:U1 small nuclear ribonucleoprotein C n=1 Tax=Ananas comosus TaxID=4615 RepID=A0A199V3E6_ANACO|nr:U1 small nuclear ribonucleoprotein C [Ananas comosus]
MPRYYCDYCDTYLTHDSPSVRKQHNAGYKHKANVRSYYQQFEEQQTQSLIDQRIKEHLGQAAAFQQQVGAAFNQHLLSMPGGMPRPRLPVLPPPVLPIGATPPISGLRPPVLPTPIVGAPGYAVAPGAPTVPPPMVPPGATSMPMQMPSLPRPPTLTPPASGGAPTAPSSASYDAFGASTAAPAAAAPSQPGFSYSQLADANH